MSETVQVPREVVDFLLGQGELEGFSYGERPAAQPNFWWRKYLRPALAAAPQATDPRDAEIERLTRERDEARAAVAWANNSLFGSHNFFLSLDGGPADEHHLDREIEELKRHSRDRWNSLSAALAEIERLREALKLLHDNIVQAFPSLTNLGPVAQARAALSPTPPEK